MLPTIEQPSNPLFTNGPNVSLNACVGDNGGPYELFEYGKGFFEGGHAAIQAAEDGAGAVDLLVYPATFAYRHGIELFLKELIRRHNSMLKTGDAFTPGHGMIKLWDDLLALHGKVENPLIEREAVDRCGEMIGHFHAIDPTGQVFRYPEDIKGNAHLKDHKLINVEVLGDHMRELQELMERWLSNLDERIAYICEAEA